MKYTTFRTTGAGRDNDARSRHGGWTIAAVLACAAVVAALSSGAARAAVAVDAVARDAVLDLLAPALAARGASATVVVAPSDGRAAPDACRRAEGFLPPGSRLAGRTVVGVRCIDGTTWQAFVSATIRVEAPTWQATRPLRPGEPIGSGDLVQAVAPLAAVDVDAAVAAARGNAGAAAGARGLVALDGRTAAPIGRTAMRSVPAGRALTAADVRDEGRVNAGDAVRVVYVGDQFTVSSEGRAVAAADPGGSLAIRLASGALVNGTLRGDHLVELAR